MQFTPPYRIYDNWNSNEMVSTHTKISMWNGRNDNNLELEIQKDIHWETSEKNTSLI
jgi:hypothetical protein